MLKKKDNPVLSKTYSLSERVKVNYRRFVFLSVFQMRQKNALLSYKHRDAATVVVVIIIVNEEF